MTDQKEQTNTMCIQMLRASTPDNIRFIIINIQQSTTPPETPVPTTPAQTLTKRIRSDNETPEASDFARPAVRTLNFTPAVQQPKSSTIKKPPHIDHPSTKHESQKMETIMKKLQNQLDTMQEALAAVQNTFAFINQTRQDMINESPKEMPYRHVVVTKTFINDLDQDTVIMLDIFQAMQENMASATEICKKIINDHQVP
ncbi:unnamed protein product [Lactuca saligna]|uniref:Uncharacterized protein n=1 Tax=Lactuca saligna TaxID=75948 RepID=A0AA35YZY9_LACSI|nr:unnamed protein product [Lactuca saligna]